MPRAVMDWTLKVMKWVPIATLFAIVGVVVLVEPAGSGTAFFGGADRADANGRASRRVADCPDGAARSRICLVEDIRPGPYRRGATKVTGVRADGTIDAERIDAAAARRGFRNTLRGIVLRRHGKAALSERYARTTTRPFSSSEATKKKAGVHAGDIFVSGLPMIDQGETAYCAVASAARVLQGYGIEVTMEDLATLAHSSPTRGTSMPSWEDAIRSVVREHGLELKVIPELTESMQPLGTLLQNYNHTADAMGCETLDCWDYIGRRDGCGCIFQDYASYDQDRDYKVQREIMLSNQRACEAFDENIIARVDDSDPLFWSVRLGDVPETSSYFDANQMQGVDGAHMRLIIGYNEKDGEILYTDSWGAGHELKRMGAEDALSITSGMYYLKDNPGGGSAAKVEVIEK